MAQQVGKKNNKKVKQKRNTVSPSTKLSVNVSVRVLFFFVFVLFNIFVENWCLSPYLFGLFSSLVKSYFLFYSYFFFEYLCFFSFLLNYYLFAFRSEEGEKRCFVPKTKCWKRTTKKNLRGNKNKDAPTAPTHIIFRSFIFVFLNWFHFYAYS